MSETAEVLPVDILDPAIHDRFVESVFEVVQANHQPNRLRRGTHIFAVAVGKCRVEPCPVDLISQPHQRMFGIEDLVEVGLEQLKRADVLGFMNRIWAS